ncbi:hypothetical protein ACFQQB_67905 [Nonomuraea rubra]|uniref:hypothetical protein n=1 Tax=Nonomuraea rubra TaxID=46180 RepID=UPI00361D9E71
MKATSAAKPPSCSSSPQEGAGSAAISRTTPASRNCVRIDLARSACAGGRPAVISSRLDRPSRCGARASTHRAMDAPVRVTGPAGVTRCTPFLIGARYVWSTRRSFMRLLPSGAPRRRCRA